MGVETKPEPEHSRFNAETKPSKLSRRNLIIGAVGAGILAGVVAIRRSLREAYPHAMDGDPAKRTKLDPLSLREIHREEYSKWPPSQRTAEARTLLEYVLRDEAMVDPDKAMKSRQKLLALLDVMSDPNATPEEKALAVDCKQRLKEKEKGQPNVE